MLGSRGRGVITVRYVQVDDRCEKPDHEEQPKVGVHAGVCVRDVLFTPTGKPGGEFIHLRQLPYGNDADDNDQEDEQLHGASVMGQ